jgi:pimeloyl-ACP methyl ester carboxylesterase
MLAAVLDRLSIHQVDLVANDSGGAVAQLFVARYPKRVRTLLLTNCDVVIDSPPPSFVPIIKLSRAGQFADRVIAPMLADKAVARSPKGLGPLAYQNPANPTDEAIDCYFTPLLSSPLRKAQLHGYALGLEQNPLTGIEPALRQAMMPVRILWGTGDTIFSAESPDWLDHAFPRSRGVRRIEGAKVFFPEEQPDLIAQEARLLWASV